MIFLFAARLCYISLPLLGQAFLVNLTQKVSSLDNVIRTTAESLVVDTTALSSAQLPNPFPLPLHMLIIAGVETVKALFSGILTKNPVSQRITQPFES